MPVSLFFRTLEDLREVDRAALSLARGRVLDVGAGVGCLSLILQEGERSVTAVEVIPEAVEIMAKRGVRDAREGRIEDLPRRREFDTLLLLMNGAALAGTMAGLPRLLRTLAGVLAPGGHVLLDSTDVLEEGGEAAGPQAWEEGEYPGEFQYQMDFQGQRGAPFPQLFVDPGTLRKAAEEGGWRMELAWQGVQGDYLARLTRQGEKAPDPA